MVEYQEMKDNSDWYYANLDVLLPKYNGRYVAIADKNVFGAFAECIDGVRALEKAGKQKGTFIVRRCVPLEEEKRSVAGGVRSRFVRASRTSVEAMLRQWHVPKAGHCRPIATALVGEGADETVTSQDSAGTVPAKFSRLPLRKGVSVRTALVYEGELEESLVRRQVFDFLIPARKLLGL